MLEQLTKLILIIIINYVFQLAGVTAVMNAIDDTSQQNNQSILVISGHYSSSLSCMPILVKVH